MTKKNYELLADVLGDVKCNLDVGYYDSQASLLDAITSRLEIKLVADNVAFKVTTFENHIEKRRVSRRAELGATLKFTNLNIDGSFKVPPTTQTEK